MGWGTRVQADSGHGKITGEVGGSKKALANDATRQAELGARIEG